MMLLRVLPLACGIFLCGAKRLDVSLHKAKLQRRPLKRLRAFNATGFRLLREGVKLPLESPGPSSLAERAKIFPWLAEYLFGGEKEAGDEKEVTEKKPEEEFSQELPLEWQGHLQAVQKLGEGSFGKVFKCKVLCGDSDDYVTVKLISDKSEDVQREIDLMEEMSGVSDFCLSSIGSPSIPSFLDTPEGYWIMMPLMNGGELYDLFHRCDANDSCGACEDELGRKCWTSLNPDYTLPYMLALFHDAVKGLAAFHTTTGFLHTDLKPENVMLNCRGSKCYAALIDLGLACDPKEPEDCRAQGTPAYIPPEVYLGDPEKGMTSRKRDVWALGVILYELLYQSLPPFYDEDGSGDQVLAYNPLNDLNIPTPPTTVDALLMQMLDPNYKRRPTVKRIDRMLKDIIKSEASKTTPVDRKALEMIEETAFDRGASTSTPACLSESDAHEVLEANPVLKRAKKHRQTSSGRSKEAERQQCTDTPRPFMNIQKCGMKRKGKRKVCCVCRARRAGKLVNAHFPMMDKCQ